MGKPFVLTLQSAPYVKGIQEMRFSTIRATGRIAIGGGLLAAMPASASELLPPTTAELAYVLNSLQLLLCGALVLFMAAGFTMVEAGSVRVRNAATITLKNIALFAVAAVTFYVFGYNLMFKNVAENGGFFGVPMPWTPAPYAGEPYAPAAYWFFQMTFVGTAASIVSGAIAERTKFWPFLLSSLVLSGFIYPLQGSWSWGGGWLFAYGFNDFAGSTVVHVCGGAAALTGAWHIGARRGRFDASHSQDFTPLSVPLVGLGTFILWLGWLGFNGGSKLVITSPHDINSMASIFLNTTLAASAGLLTVIAVTWWKKKRIHVLMALNGALGGLVSITAEPLLPTPGLAIVVGAVGGLIVVWGSLLLERRRIDDVVGAIPVHLGCGLWGTMAVCLSNSNASLYVQLIGTLSVALFTMLLSGLTWLGLSKTVGLRVSEEEEQRGSDATELCF
jgi:ammonium transporter, Amt family